MPFKPDDWQRKLLDIIDSGNSALVVAPTASGKTFIAYYVMEMCLRANDTDVVVYVAPTSALVDQVYHEIQARFTKRYNGDMHLTGIFNTSYRKEHLKCQVNLLPASFFPSHLLFPSSLSFRMLTLVSSFVVPSLHPLPCPLMSFLIFAQRFWSLSRSAWKLCCWILPTLSGPRGYATSSSMKFTRSEWWGERFGSVCSFTPPPPSSASPPPLETSGGFETGCRMWRRSEGGSYTSYITTRGTTTWPPSSGPTGMSCCFDRS